MIVQTLLLYVDLDFFVIKNEKRNFTNEKEKILNY